MASEKRVRPEALVVLVPVVALVATVWLPFVNTATLWFGLPSVMVWSGFWVIAITPALALSEFGARQREQDRVDTERDQAAADREGRR